MAIRDIGHMDRYGHMGHWTYGHVWLYWTLHIWTCMAILDIVHMYNYGHMGILFVHSAQESSNSHLELQQENMLEEGGL